MSSNSHLPNFARPPVTEVVLAVGFDPLEGLKVPQLGILWNTRFRDRFPKIEEQPPLEPANERFGGGPLEVSVTIETTPMVPRLWFLNHEGSELVQIQRNWFARNWRKLSESTEYPRYPSLREPFVNDFKAFELFVSDEKLGEISPSQCEVTYVNHIVAEKSWKGHGDLGQVLKLFSPVELPSTSALVEQARLDVKYLIHDEGHEPIGRLHISVAPGFRRVDNRPIYVVTLTARGRPSTPDLNGVLRFLDMGRAQIVQAFDAITTSTMHDEWGFESGTK